MTQICAREFCPVEFDASAINAKIEADKAALGFEFKARMEFGATCRLCSVTKYWERFPDGTIRLRAVAPVT